jgi:hypothetical protein
MPIESESIAKLGKTTQQFLELNIRSTQLPPGQTATPDSISISAVLYELTWESVDNGVTWTTTANRVLRRVNVAAERIAAVPVQSSNAIIAALQGLVYAQLESDLAAEEAAPPMP